MTTGTQELTPRELRQKAVSGRTIFLAKLLGVYLIVIGLSMLIETRANYEYAVTGIVADPPLALLVSVLAVLGGLAMVLVHNVWRGGPLPVVVTLLGWITLAKGLLSLLLPAQMDEAFYQYQMHFVRLYYFYAVLSLVLGAYLTYGGFTSRART